MAFAPIRLDAHNPGPMTGSGNHTYVLVDEAGTGVLIDAGVAQARHLDELHDHLRANHATLGSVLVTHAHGDHINGVEAIAGRWPSARFFKYAWVEEDARHGVPWHPLRDGDRISLGGDALVALHTPGHSPDHVAFWHEASRTAFTGDLVVAGSSVTIQASRGGDLVRYLESLERVLSLKPARLLPAHGPDVDDPDALIRSYIAHRLMREDQVLHALAAGLDTIAAIAGSVYDGLPPALIPAAHDTVRAHLEKLRQERRAIELDGRWRRLPA